jgi:hypothetical protein
MMCLTWGSSHVNHGLVHVSKDAHVYLLLCVPPTTFDSLCHSADPAPLLLLITKVSLIVKLSLAARDLGAMYIEKDKEGKVAVA